MNKINKTAEEWKRSLSPKEYQIAREKGTEKAFTGEYNCSKGAGEYQCRCCGLPLFDAEHKYDSGSGWPSFTQPLVNEHVAEEIDTSLTGTRTEVLCAQCDAHLGHVFPDGPGAEGLRYCVNSASLNFKKIDKE
tara:strand:+ start:281 stop:682 length:402 start_codon:yes stop_codon:yes gene_type:complete